MLIAVLNHYEIINYLHLIVQFNALFNPIYYNWQKMKAPQRITVLDNDTV